MLPKSDVRYVVSLEERRGDDRLLLNKAQVRMPNEARVIALLPSVHRLPLQHLVRR